MSELSAHVATDKPCRDPECDGLAEMEQDADHLYYECTTCGFTFDFEKIEMPDACQIGLSETTRRALTPSAPPPPKHAVPVSLKSRR